MDDAYMLFGGNASEQGGHFTNVLLSGLAQRHVSFISQRYPDFTQCRSPGAASAKQAIEHLALIGRDGRARSTLLEALRLHEERIQDSGERTCVSLRGQQLHLTSARARSLRPLAALSTSPRRSRTAASSASRASHEGDSPLSSVPWGSPPGAG